LIKDHVAALPEQQTMEPPDNATLEEKKRFHTTWKSRHEITLGICKQAVDYNQVRLVKERGKDRKLIALKKKKLAEAAVEVQERHLQHHKAKLESEELVRVSFKYIKTQNSNGYQERPPPR
jgi:hypothetical protein